MAKTAALPFKGNFDHTQSFGARPSVYAKFGLAGHDGDDWMMPVDTPLVSPLNGEVLSTGNDADGWGIYAQVWDRTQNLLINVTHMRYTNVWKGKVLKIGDRLGGSGNTGFSEAPHVHVAAADTDSAGNRLNQGNGFKGWYSILDSGKITLQSQPATETPGPTTPISGTVTFDEIYTQYYPGWGRVEAEADFYNTYGGDLNKLKIARGESPGGTEELRPPELEKTYYLIPALDQLSLNQIASGIPLGRADILAGFLNLDPNTKLISGQALNAAGFPTSYFPDSGEWQGFKKLVGLTPIGTPGSYYVKPQYAGKSLNEIRNEANLAFRPDILASFLAVSEFYKIPAYQTFGTQGFPSSYVPNSGEYQGFLAIFTTTPPTQPNAPTTNPEEPAPEVINTNPPDTGEGLTPEETPTPTPTIPEGTTALILSKLDQILAKLEGQGGQGEVPAPPAEEASGGLFVSSSPTRAAIYLDGAFQFDYTPSNFTYQVSPGKHALRLKKTGYKTWEQEVEIAPDIITNIEATLEQIQTPLS